MNDLTGPIPLIDPERDPTYGHDAYRLRVPASPERTAVALWRLDSPEGAYYTTFDTNDIGESALVGRIRRVDQGPAVIGPARIVHEHDMDSLLDPGWFGKFSAIGLLELFEVQALLPWLDGVYRIDGETHTRDPQTGLPTRTSEA